MGSAKESPNSIVLPGCPVTGSTEAGNKRISETGGVKDQQHSEAGGAERLVDGRLSNKSGNLLRSPSNQTSSTTSAMKNDIK